MAIYSRYSMQEDFRQDIIAQVGLSRINALSETIHLAACKSNDLNRT